MITLFVKILQISFRETGLCMPLQLLGFIMEVLNFYQV